MGPLASRLKRGVCLFLVFCLLPWQEPARVFAQTTPPPAAPAGATLSLDGLPPDVKSQVDAILRGPNGGAFLANAQKAKLPEITARLTQLADEKVDARDPQVLAARAELNAWVKDAGALTHDWKGAADSEAAYKALLAHLTKRHADVSTALDARAAAAPIVDQLRGQLQGGPALEGELKTFQKNLYAYMRTGSESDMSSAVGAMDALYQKAGIHDDGARARMFTDIGSAARAQGDALAVRAGPGDGKPFAGYQGSGRRLTDQGLAVPGVATVAAGPAAGPSPADQVRDAVGATTLGLESTVLGGLVPGVDLRALADKSAKLAERLEAMAGIPAAPAATRAQAKRSGEVASALAAAYAAVSEKVVAAVMDAPYRDGPDAAKPAALADFRGAAWPAKVAKILKTKAFVLGARGPGLWGAAQAADAKFAKEILADGEAAAGLPAARERAKTLVGLLQTLQSRIDGGMDLTTLSREDRERLLGAQVSAESAAGHESELGLYGAMLLAQDKETAQRKANGDKIVAAIAALGLTGDPEKDMAALDKLFENADTAALLDKADMPPAILSYIRARAYEKGGSKGPRPDGLPTADEAYADIVFANRLLAQSQAPNSVRKTWANLYLAHYDVNRKTFDALCSGDSAPKSGEAAQFCEQFPQAPKLADASASADELKTLALRQQSLTELVKDYLQHRPLIAAMEDDQKKRAALISALRKLDPEATEYLRKQGVDVDGLLRDDRKRLIASWLVSAHELGVDKDPARAAEWEAARSELFGPEAAAATTAQSTELKRRLAEPQPSAARLAEVLNGMENPELITRGFAMDVSRLQSLPRAMASSRDRDLLTAWQGQAEQLRSAAEYYEGEAAKAAAGSPEAAELKEKADVIRAAVADPKDADRLLRAYRLSGRLVLDERTLRVGLDSRSVKVPPASESDKLDLEALRALMSALKVEGNPVGDPGAAATLRAKLLDMLKGDVCDKQDAYRGKQLLFSTADQYTDQLRLLNDVATRKVGGQDVRPGFADQVLSTRAMADLRAFMPLSNSAVAAMDFATQKLFDARQTRAGRAELDLSGSLALLRVQTMSALTDARYGLDGFTAHGWTIGRQGDVQRVNGFQTAGQPADGVPAGSEADQKLIKGIAGDGVPSAALRKAARMNGLVTVNGGVTTFVSLDGKYSQRTEAVTVDGVPVSRATSVPGVTGPIDVRYDAKTKRYYSMKPVESLDGDGKFKASQERHYLTAAEARGAKFEALEHVTVDYRGVHTTIDQTQAGTVLRYSNSRVDKAGVMTRTSVDLESHSLDVSRVKDGQPIHQFSFDLDDKNAHLAASRRTTESFLDAKTGQPVKPPVTTWLDFDKEKGTARVLREWTDGNDANLRVTQAVSGSIGGPGADDLLLARRTADPVGEPVSATVRVNREGLSRDEMSAAYAHASHRAAELMVVNGKLGGSDVDFNDYVDQMRAQMNFYDGSVGSKGDIDAAFTLDPSGGFKPRLSYYASDTRRVTQRKEDETPYTRYTPLPEKAPQDAPNLDTDALFALRYAQNLAAMRAVTGRPGLFIVPGGDGVAPTKFFDPSRPKIREISYGGDVVSDDHWYGGNPINRPIFVDGANSGQKILVGETLGLNNFHEHAGRWLGNYVRYQWKPFNDPKWDAVAGGIVDGLAAGLLDPKLWIITAATMGGGLLVQLAAKSAITIVRVASTVGKIVLKGAEIYFQVGLIEGGIGAAKSFKRYSETGNNDDLYAGAQGVAAMGAGFLAMHLAKGKIETIQEYTSEKLGLIPKSGPEGMPERPPEKTSEKPPESRPTDSRPPESRPPESQPPDSRPPDSRPPESQPPESRPPESRPPESRPPESPPPESRPPESRPPESRPPESSLPEKPAGPTERGAPAMPHVADALPGGGGTLDAPGAGRIAEGGSGGDLRPGGTGATSNGAAGLKAGGAPAAEGAGSAKEMIAMKPAENVAAPRAAEPAVSAARETATAEQARASDLSERAASARDASRAADLRASESQTAATRAQENAIASSGEQSSTMRLADLAEQRAGGLERAAERAAERGPAEKAAEARERAAAAREQADGAKEKASAARDRAETARKDAASAKDEAAQAKEDASLARQEAKSATLSERAQAKTAEAAERAAAKEEAAASKRGGEPLASRDGAAPGEAAGEGAPAAEAARTPGEAPTAGEGKAARPEPKGRWESFKDRVKAADQAGAKWEKENLPTFLRAGEVISSKARALSARFETSDSLAVRLVRTPLRLSRTLGSAVERLGEKADIVNVLMIKAWRGVFGGGPVEFDAAGRRLTTKVARDGTVSKVPAGPGFIAAPFIQAGQLLQGRVFPEGGRRQTTEEIWNPRLTDRGSLLKAAPKEIPPEGASVKGALDLATGRLMFGKEAEAFKGERADVTLRVEREGKKGLRLADFEVAARDPADQARARAQMGDQLAYELDVTNQQAALKDLLLGSAAADALRANRHALKDETYLDVHYDAAAGEFRPGASKLEPGARLRFALDPQAGWRLTGAEPTAGAPLPLAARYNLALSESVVVPEAGLKTTAAAAPELPPAEAGALLESRMRELDRSVAEADRPARAEADRLVAQAEADVARRAGPSPRELTAAEKLVAEKSADFYGMRERLRRSERAAVENQAALDQAGVSARSAEQAVARLRERDAARAALDAADPNDAGASNAAVSRLRRAQEDLSRAAKGMTEGVFDAVVARHEAESAAAAAREQLGTLYGELKGARRTALEAGEDAALARAVGRYDAAVRARSETEGVLELRRDGLHASVGADAAALARIRLQAMEGGRGAGGREIEFQGATERCVLASLADQISLARPEAARATLLDVENAIRRIKGDEAGGALIEKIERRGMTQPEIAELAPKIAAEFGLETAAVARGELFKRVAAGETVSVVLTRKGSAVLDVDGGPHMVNLSNWRVEPDVAGRLRVVLDMADPNIRVRDAAAPDGAPRYASKTVTVTLDEIMPMLRGRLSGFGPDAAGLVFRAKAESARPETAPKTPLPPQKTPLSEETAGEPESPLKLPTAEKTNGLQQLKNSLEARGAADVLELADKIYYVDPLTGLPNRAFYVDRAPAALAGVKDPAVAMLDMNNFGAVNVGLADLHGVTQGRARADAVLGIAGATLGKLGAAHGVSVVRLGGEEFVVLGPRDAVVEFSAAAKQTLRPDRLLDEAGMTAGSPERTAIAAAMERMGRGGQPVADFTYGVADVDGRTLKDAATAADLALAHGKDTAGRGAITLETPDGFRDWSKPAGSAPLETLPRAPPPRTEANILELEAKLTPKEKLIFQEAAFKDPLTMARSYEFLTIKERDWNKFYADGGMVMVSSARNLKQINDILGHDAGDLYLRNLGRVMRSAINRARNVDKLDVQEPVRVASKEFMLVGKDAKLVSELAAKAVAESFDGGRMLTPEQVQRLRVESVRRGAVSEEGAKLIGTLRAVAEPIRDQGGRADVRGALDRAFVSLEAMKVAENNAGIRQATALAPAGPLPPQGKVLKPSDLRPGGKKTDGGVGTADISHYERYFSAAEIRAAHPEPESGGVYHDWQHTVKVADMAREFAAARGLSAADVKFISEVGLLHDFDPTRAPGTAARVTETLARLREDFAGTKSLTGEPGRSILKERFGWDEPKLKMAEALIQRTEFPFGDKDPRPAYQGTSPVAQYESMLKNLPPGDRKFVLREGALLSEYADKSSWYATEDFNAAHKVVDGLVDEINRGAGKPVVDAAKLGTDGFLGKIGEPESFVHDRALAEKFGVELKLENRAEAFRLLPERYGRTFEANLEGFRALNEAARAGDPAALEKGRAAAAAMQGSFTAVAGKGAASALESVFGADGERGPAAKGVGSADMSHYERYFSAAEIRAAHPEPESGGVYHDWRHTVKVADMAREFASARGLAPAEVKFISEVGLLHDFDPTRAPGMPARVPETLARLREDFAGTKSLTGEPGRSILKERFGWDEAKLHMAEALIQRTEFPFGDSHPSPAYKGTSPLAVYESMLRDLPPGDRAFVLREGALLSEYADKSSWYATEDFNGAHKVVEGLVDEINRTIGKPVMDVGKLGTDGFLGKIGEPESFVHDRALAEKFGVELKLENRAEAFKLLPERYGRTFESNLEGFRALNEAAKAGDPAAMEKGQAAAALALLGPDLILASPGFRAVLEAAALHSGPAALDGVLPGEHGIRVLTEAAAARVVEARSLLNRVKVDPESSYQAKSYASLPAELRGFGEKFYGETAAQASPRMIARSDATSGADPAWWSDHGVNHMINIVENSPVVLDAAMKSGLIETRPAGGRYESMELMGKVNAVLHDIWMKDLTPEGRKNHPARAGREAFSAELDQAARDLLSSKQPDGRTFRRVLSDVYKIDDADAPRVLREMMALSYAHSKSNVPLEVLRDPVRLREAMKKVVTDPETTVPFQRFYEEKGGGSSFDAKAFDWLTAKGHEALSQDMIDVTRCLRVADSFRWRGSADFRASNGANIGTAQVEGKVYSYMRLSDAESGRTYMVLYDSPKVMGEANIKYTRLDGDGALAIGVEKGDFGSKENTRTVSEGTADIIYDIAKDYVGSFESGARQKVRIEIPAETPELADALRREFLSLADKDVKKSPAFSAAFRTAVEEGRVEFVAAKPAPKVEQLKSIGADMENGRFIRAPAARFTPAQAARLEEAIRDGGVNLSAVDFEGKALAGAKMLTLAKGEFLVARGMKGDFVYIPLDEGSLQPVLGKSYKPSPLRRGVPVGELGVLTGNARNADVAALRDGVQVLAIPKDTYLREWTKAYFTHDTILGRLKADYPAEDAKAATPADVPAARPALDSPSGIGSSDGGGIWGRLFGRGKSGGLETVSPRRWYLEDAPEPVKLPAGARVTGAPLAGREAVHANVVAAEISVDGKVTRAVVKIDAKPNEPRVLAAMEGVELPANVRIPRLLGAEPADSPAARRLLDAEAVAKGGIDPEALARSAREGRYVAVMERLPDDFVSMRDVLAGHEKLPGKISRKDWRGLNDALDALHARGLGFGDLNNTTNIRVRQTAGPDGLPRTEFALIDTGDGTLAGRADVLAGDRAQLRGAQGLETQLLSAGLLERASAAPSAELKPAGIGAEETVSFAESGGIGVPPPVPMENIAKAKASGANVIPPLNPIDENIRRLEVIQNVVEVPLNAKGTKTRQRGEYAPLDLPVDEAISVGKKYYDQSLIKPAQLKDDKWTNMRKSWQDGSLAEVLRKLAQDPSDKTRSVQLSVEMEQSGPDVRSRRPNKLVFLNPATGKRVVYDRGWNYFRIEDMKSPGTFLDQDFHSVKAPTDDEIMNLTHFRNDKP